MKWMKKGRKNQNMNERILTTSLRKKIKIVFRLFLFWLIYKIYYTHNFTRVDRTRCMKILCKQKQKRTKKRREHGKIIIDILLFGSLSSFLFLPFPSPPSIWIKINWKPKANNRLAVVYRFIIAQTWHDAQRRF